MSKAMTYKAAVFDFDYTLGDATDAIVAGFNHAFTTMGYPAPEREAVRRTVGMQVHDAYTLLTGDGRETERERFYSLFHPVARSMQAQGTPLCAGAKELLLALDAAGVRTAVVSTKNTSTLNAIFAQHGLDRILSEVVGGDMVASPKPDPQGLAAVMERLGVRAAEVLYCGDTVIDAETAQRAGTDFCAVLNGTTAADAFDVWPHVHIAPDLWDLKSWLGL